MPKIIDLRLDFPPTANEFADRMKFFVLNKEGKGIANYRRIFGPQWAASLGTSFKELEKVRQKSSEEELVAFLRELARNIVITPSQFEQQMDEAGIEWALIESEGHNKTADRISQLPNRLKGMARFNPFEGAKAVREIERAINRLNFLAVYASPYRWGIKADDPRFYPCYAKAVELDIPVFIYTAMNYRTDFPMDVGRPLYLDREWGQA